MIWQRIGEKTLAEPMTTTLMMLNGATQCGQNELSFLQRKLMHNSITWKSYPTENYEMFYFSFTVSDILFYKAHKGGSNVACLILI